MSALGLRRKDVEARSGISPSSLRRMLRGKDAIDPLVMALGVALDLDPLAFRDFWRGRISEQEMEHRVRARQHQRLDAATRAELLRPIAALVEKLERALQDAMAGEISAGPVIDAPASAPAEPQRPPAATAKQSPKR